MIIFGREGTPYHGLNTSYNQDRTSLQSWNSLDSWPSASTGPQPRSETTDKHRQYQSADLLDMMVKRSTLQDMMDEFKMNGYDTPYNPEEDNMSMSSRSGDLIGMGSPGVYLRQTSWPEPKATPVQRLPRPKSEWIQSASAAEFTRTNRFQDDIELTSPLSPPPVNQLETISAEQVRVLNSLPNAVLYGLLRDLEQKRTEAARNKRVPDECRFCKNNGERESYYRSHVLKDGSGRVTCPVLRKFVCKRCGARGDHAHTVKYCPLSTDEERIKSTAMMRSVRLASGRRRAPAAAEPAGDYVMFGDTSPSFLQDVRSCAPAHAPLDPLWARLEHKLSS